MFDLGWSKLIVIAIIAIVVVGPKDLPPLLRALGKFLSQLRRQADEFRTHFNEAMRDTGYDEVKRDIAGIKAAATSTAYDISRQLDESVKPLHDAAADVQRAADADVTGASAVTGDAVSSYVEGQSASVGDMLPAPAPLSPPTVVPSETAAYANGSTSNGLTSNGHAVDAQPQHRAAVEVPTPVVTLPTHPPAATHVPQKADA